MRGARLLVICLLAVGLSWLPLRVQAAPAQQTPAPSTPFYGVQGHFEAVQGQNFGSAFVTDGGMRLSAAGASPAVEQQIDVLAAQTPPATVKIWETRNFDPKTPGVADLVISELLTQGDQVQPAPVAASQPSAIINFSLVNLYSTPTQSMSVVGQARAGEKCTLMGRDQSGAWLLVDCGDTQGWIDRRLVNVSVDLGTVPIVNSQVSPQPPASAPTATPAPTAVAPPPVFQGWKASYFNNPTLTGNPVAYEDAPNLDFNWGAGSPSPLVPVDYFSARFERTFSLQQGYYKFNLLADDGARLFLDNELIINEWHQSTGIQYAAARWLSGMHTFKIEYLELVGTASIRFTTEYSPEAPPWQVVYYEGAPGRGQAKSQQGDFAGSIQLNHTWANNSPVPGVLPNEGWNARWVGQFTFAGGNFIFRARADDGVTVYLNDTLVINGWSDGPHDISNSFKSIGAGKHTVTVDYYDRFGYAYVSVFWYPDQYGPNYMP